VLGEQRARSSPTLSGTVMALRWVTDMGVIIRWVEGTNRRSSRPVGPRCADGDRPLGGTDEAVAVGGVDANDGGPLGERDDF
jgi:hypothetical protein